MAQNPAIRSISTLPPVVSFSIPTLQKPLPLVLTFQFSPLTICFPNANKVAFTSLLQSSPPPPTPDNLRTNSTAPRAHSRPMLRRNPTREIQNANLGLDYLRFVRRLGSGNIRSMYLVELKRDSGGGVGVGDSTKYMFAAKVMDKKESVSRNKEGRAKTERHIGNIIGPPLFANTLCYIRHTYTSFAQAW